MKLASSFFTHWKSVVSASPQKEKLQKIWRNKSLFTNAIFHDEDAVLIQLAKRLELECYSENYYFLDALFYKKEHLVPHLTSNKYWFREISIAFEHENTFNSQLFQEVSHLLLTQAPLRVLVSYPDTDNNEEIQLNKLHEIIKGRSDEEQIAQDESFLLIFGYENDFSWKGLIYNSEDWKVL